MKQRIINLLKNFGVEPTAVTEEAHFIKDLGFDSLDTVDLMMQLEQEFAIVIPDEDYAKITTIRSLMSYLEEHQAVEA
ncbi:acyl carrier protein [Rhabdobacter roseus]|uniref:Acyl carrier protein n=1 Tax=Rhabdobacter roseus TaxID=1655419 RepID=A0A840U0I2_9BACT|nr:acyl carrier protein [Rhabdobacter roseus]MBB5285389.1 acyl carrier protein [Rhabdobacter roseus]